MRRQDLRRRRVGAGVWVAALYLVAAIVATWPLAAHATDATPTAHADSRLTAWIMAWEAHVLPEAPSRIFQAPYLATEPDTLAYTEHMTGLGILAAPLNRLTGNPFLAQNVLLIVAIAGSAFAAHLLVFELTGSRAAGVVGGMAYAFAPYWANHFMHIQLVATGWMPAAAFGLVRWIRSERVRWLALAAAAAFLAAITSWYQAAFVAATLVVLGGVLVWFRRPARPLRFGAQAIVAVAALVAALTPFALPYRHVVSRDAGYRRSLADVARYSARPSFYLAAPPENLLYGRATKPWRAAAFNEEKTLFPGIGVLALAVVGIASVIRGRRHVHPSPDRRVAAVAGAALVVTGVVLSFGASAGGPRRFTPWAFLYHNVSAVQGLRAATRAHVIALLGGAILAGLGAHAVIERVRRRTLAASLVAGVLFLEGLAIPLSLGPAPKPPALYARLERTAGLVLEFPARLPGVTVRRAQQLDADYMTSSVGRWYRLANGYSGFTPRSYEMLLDDADRLPDPSALDALRARGIDRLIVHLDLVAGTKWAGIVEQLTAQPGVRLVARDRSIAIFGL